MCSRQQTNVVLHAEHKQHNCAGGLPCELSSEELQLALQQGNLTRTAALRAQVYGHSQVSVVSSCWLELQDG